MNYELLVAGTSLGGLAALKTILQTLPKNFPIPIVAVQHRAPSSDEILTEQLQKECALVVSEPHDKDTLRPGFIYIAPPDYHLLVEQNHLALSLEAPFHFSRPSVDVLFESAARSKRAKVIGLVLTGMGNDGAGGLAAIKARGGYAIVQDPKTAEMPAMPEAAMNACAVDRVVPILEIGLLLINLAYDKNA